MTLRPAAVLDFARRLGAEPRTAASRVELTQSGLLRSGPNTRWMHFTARQLIRLDRPEFRWVARTGPLGLLTVCDELQHEVPRGSISLLNTVSLITAVSSPALMKAELMRYLAELPWAPDAILSNNQLGWTQVSCGKLRVTTSCAGVQAAVTFILDGDGLVSAVEAEDRPRQEGRRMKERPWRGTFSDYRAVDGRKIPHTAEVGWTIDSAIFPVWRGHLESWKVIST